MEAGEKGPIFGRFIGRAKPPTVTLKRSMTKTGATTTWIWAGTRVARTLKSAAYRTAALKPVRCRAAPTPVKTYYLTNAIPTKVEIAGHEGRWHGGRAPDRHADV